MGSGKGRISYLTASATFGILVMKTCHKCERNLPNDAFSRHVSQPDGLFIWCKECRSKYRKEAYLARHPDRAARVAAKMAGIEPSTIYKSKVCIDCLEEKPISQFPNRKAGKDKRMPYCFPCSRIRAANWEAKNKDKAASRRLAWRQKSPRQSINVSLLGALKRRPCDNPATLNELMAMWETQGGLCAMSGVKMTWAQGKVLPTSITLDRIDPFGDYTIDNVRLLCHAVNSFRGRMSDAEMISMARAIVAKADACPLCGGVNCTGCADDKRPRKIDWSTEPTWNSHLVHSEAA
jgi:hypothetical protein